MTYEEALKWLDEHSIDNLEVKATISKALEKQIPKKPDNRSFTGATLLYCPSCGNYLDLQPNFCYECGQAIDWS